MELFIDNQIEICRVQLVINVCRAQPTIHVDGKGHREEMAPLDTVHIRYRKPLWHITNVLCMIITERNDWNLPSQVPLTLYLYSCPILCGTVQIISIVCLNVELIDDTNAEKS